MLRSFINIIIFLILLINSNSFVSASKVIGDADLNGSILISHINNSEYGVQTDNQIDFIYSYKDGTERSYSKIEVFPNGMMIIPKLGERQVYGRSVKEIKEILLTELVDLDSVEIFIHRVANNVSVLGEVNSPGSYPMKDIKTVYDAIAKAEGFTNVAKKTKVKLVRQRRDGTRVAYVIDFPKEVFNAYEKGSGIGEEIYLLREGDLIHVPGSVVKKTWEIFKKALSAATFGVFTGLTNAAIN